MLLIDAPQYMSTRLGQSSPSSVERLQNVAFIPVKSSAGITLARPTDVYFLPNDGSDSPYKMAFTFVDFGDKANLFLRYCGVKAEPSVKGEFNCVTLNVPDFV